MKVPLQITSRNVSLSDAAENTIRLKAAKLDMFFDKITSCRITIDMPHRHSHQGIHYNVQIDITVPGSELIVKREPNEDLYVSIRDAFDAARRQLQNYASKLRGDVKTHEILTVQGRISKLVHKENYGFITAQDGREIYFHRNSLKHGDYEKLSIDNIVRYIEEQGEQGPQATTVITSAK